MDLFSTVVDKDCLVVLQLGMTDEGAQCRNVKFLRSLQHWEIDSADIFMELLWLRLSKKEKFNVHSF